MLTVRDLTPADRDLVLPMVEAFYHSDAVDHVVPMDILERAFQAAVDPDEPLLRGLLLLEDGVPAGYAYLSLTYSCEVGGRCLFIEEIFLQKPFRGRGLGRQTLEWIQAQYPALPRLRLEVTQANQAAVRLYQSCGFQFLHYGQMVLDRPSFS